MYSPPHSPVAGASYTDEVGPLAPPILIGMTRDAALSLVNRFIQLHAFAAQTSSTIRGIRMPLLNRHALRNDATTGLLLGEHGNVVPEPVLVEQLRPAVVGGLRPLK